MRTSNPWIESIIGGFVMMDTYPRDRRGTPSNTCGILIAVLATLLGGQSCFGWSLPAGSQRPIDALKWSRRTTAVFTGSGRTLYIVSNKPGKEEDIALANELLAGAALNVTSDLGPSPVVTYEDVTPITNIRTGTVNPPNASLFIAKKQVFPNMQQVVIDGYKINAELARNAENLVERPKFVIKEDPPVEERDIKAFIQGVISFQRKTPFQTTRITTPYDEALTDSPVMVEFQVVVSPFSYILPFTSVPQWTGLPGAATANFQPAFESFCAQSFQWTPDRRFPAGNAAYKIVLRDRTPPRITDLAFNQGTTLPLLSGPGSTAVSRATTNDFYRPTELRGVDNISTQIQSRFGIERISGPTPPGVNAPNGWQWVGGVVTSVSSAPIPFETFLPNDCLGEMKYTAFAWDDSLVMNPGESQIVENRPDVSYGIRGPYANQDLGNSPLPNGALPFPVSAPGDPNSLDITRRIPEAEGTIFVDDNDFPNLLVRVTSSKDKGRPKSDLHFPPPPPVLSTFDRPVYDQFVARARYTPATLPAGGYVRFLKADLDNCPPGERTSQWQYGIGLVPPGGVVSPDFAKNAFTLENYVRSDTDSQGILIDHDPSSFGERNGFGKSLAVFCLEPLIEDVEYEVALWAEDNCKWINLTDASLGYPALVGARIAAPFTGIESAGIDCVVPNQYPKVVLKTGMGSDRYVSETLRVTFREPTRLGGLPTPGDTAAWDEGYPSITAWAKDYKGNERRLKIYFQVTDEKVKVRVMEQQHVGN
ncbi:MAG TPA: hypothetical protein PLP29_02775 [Candidatus Ozemobacteraceae bacterium]|nr:hypothetical protein [Candidatus Ozemobacteraceae bacterium]